MKVSVCAETLYTRESFENRIELLAEHGISTIEFWQWHNKDSEKLRSALERSRMNLLGFCVDSKNADISKYISAAALNGNNEAALLTAVKESIQTAKYLNAKNLIVTVGDNISELSYDKQRENIIRNLNLIKGYFENEKITLLIEPINLNERRAYLMPNVKNIIPIVSEINSEYVRILYDIYHQSMENDFSTEDLKKSLPYVGHIHMADCPGRGEPGTGNVNFAEIINMLKEEKYDKYIGTECFPKSEDAVYEAIKRLGLQF